MRHGSLDEFRFEYSNEQNANVKCNWCNVNCEKRITIRELVLEGDELGEKRFSV